MRRHTDILFARGKEAALIVWMFMTLTLAGLCSSITFAANFIAPELLGRPTNSSVTVNAVADTDLDVYIEYGTASGIYEKQTLPVTFSAGTPIEFVMNGLLPNTRYYYRMNYRSPGQAQFSQRDEHTFHTQRSPGSSFTFTVQADSHLYDPKCVDEIYTTTLLIERNDAPDFYFELGDTFGADKFLPPDYQTIAQLHLDQRPFLGIVGHSSPLFFVLGNHEGEAGYALDGTADNIVVYATTARKLYYPNPVPDGFYTGNSNSEAYVGLPEDYYAWEWGDALFVVIDPYRYTTTNPKASGDSWDWTLGQTQYTWLKETLENSSAKFKFVFSHHVLGDVRGAVGWADTYEWGGYNKSGTWEFDTKRPGWAMPIHQLMVQNSVTIFFQGHDHLFAKEELDGIVYQEVPQPSSPTGSIPNAEYYFGDVLPASGYLRVTVSGSAVKVDYIRTYLPGEGTNGEVAYTYTIPSSAPTNFTITVTKSGSGSGTVTSVPSAIDCGNTCNASFPERSVVNLTAEVNAGSTFSGWTGCDSTSGDVCTVLINGDRNISASFAKSYRGTVGSQITLTNFGYGIRKGRVLIENAPTRIINWNDSSITFQIRKSLSIGLHNIVVKPIEPRGAIPITLGGVLTMMAPEIVAVDPASGAPGDVITLSGNYFGTIKPRVFIEDSTSGRKKYCRITYRNMEPTTGQSTLSFITPKLPQGHNPGAYLLKLNNRIGTTETTFTVDPIPP